MLDFLEAKILGCHPRLLLSNTAHFGTTKNTKRTKAVVSYGVLTLVWNARNDRAVSSSASHIQRLNRPNSARFTFTLRRQADEALRRRQRVVRVPAQSVEDR